MIGVAVGAVALVSLWTVLGIYGWRLHLAHRREAARTASPRDGVPRGIIPPRNHWHVTPFPTPPGLFWRVRRIRERDIAHHFADAYVRKWVAWELTACAFGRGLVVQYWRERWAA